MEPFEKYPYTAEVIAKKISDLLALERPNVN
jgi:hypothetical protein